MPNEEAGKIDTRLSDQTTSFHDQIDEVRRIAEESLRYSKNLHDQLTRAGSPLELQQAVATNTETLQHLYALVQSIKKWIRWQRTWFWVKATLIIIPITLGAIFLPPYWKKSVEPYWNQYRSLQAAISGTPSQSDFEKAVSNVLSDPVKLEQLRKALMSQ